MKRFLLVAAIGFLLNSCMDLNMRFQIGKDWSNDLTLSLQMLDQFYKMMEMQMAQAGGDLSLFDKDALTALVNSQGGEIKKFSNQVVEGMRQIGVQVKFPDARSMFTSMSQDQMSLAQEGEDWVWRFNNEQMEAALSGLDPQQLEQQLSMLLPSLSGLKLNLELEVPHLVETNLQKAEGQIARFSIDFDKDITGKTGKEIADLFLSIARPKWVKFRLENP